MRWFMLPVSVGAHVIAALAMLIVPLAAEVEWPSPAPLHSAMVTTIATVPPPPPPVRQAPVRAGQGVREPRKIVDVPPIYPPIALNARIEGQ